MLAMNWSPTHMFTQTNFSLGHEFPEKAAASANTHQSNYFHH